MLARKVVCAVGLEHWQPTLVRRLAPLKDAGCRELVLAHVVRAEEMLGHVPSLLKEDLRDALGTATRRTLEELVEISRTAGLAARAVIEIQLKPVGVSEVIVAHVLDPRLFRPNGSWGA